MTRKEIIDGLKFTVDMFLFDHMSGETFTVPKSDMDKITIDACKGAIELLEQEPCEDAISRADAKKYLSAPDANGDRVIYESDLDLLPSVTPQPKMGRWINMTGKQSRLKDGMTTENVKCSEMSSVLNVMNGLQQATSMLVMVIIALIVEQRWRR